MTLTEFLLARIAEDEGVALAVREESFNPDEVSTGDDPWPSEKAFAEQFTTTRVLAECEAKRRIVDEAMEVARHERTVAVMAGVGHTEPTSGETIIRLLALPYADHPDYREEWKP